MHLDDRKHRRLIKSQLPELQAQQRNYRDTKHRGEENFAKVKATGRGNIHSRIGVVHPVKSPREGDAVIHPVPEIHPGIE